MLSSYFNKPVFSQEGTAQDTADLSLRVADLERTIEELKANNEITRNLPFEEQDAIREIVNDKLADSVWNDFFYFSGLDPVGSVMVAADVFRYGETNEQLSLSINNESRLRIVFNLLVSGTGSAYLTTAHVRPVDVAYDITDTTGEWVGIKISGDIMYGVSSRRGVQTNTIIKTAVATLDDYVVEIRFFPNNRVDFYVDYVYAGSITTNLPSDDTLEIFELFYAEVTTGTTQVDIQRIEFLQKNK